MRRQNLDHYRRFLTCNGHAVVERPEDSDAILLWTCAFRQDVLENSLAELVRYGKYRAKIIATGCLPDIAPNALRERFNGQVIAWKNEAEEFERFFGCAALRFRDASPIFAEAAVCDDAAKYRKEHADADATFHDQFIKLLVSEGCPYTCTYCTERLAFPAFRSFPLKQLAEACRAVVSQTGKTRVILLSDCLGEYGRDIGSSLPELLRELRAVDPRLSFALNNLHPANVLQHFDEFRVFLRNGWICHLNLPIQSASDRVLRLMNRIYTQDGLKRIFGMLREINFQDFDTHVILGFPGETEEDFDETVNFLLHYRPRYVLLSKFFEAPPCAGGATSKQSFSGRNDSAHRTGATGIVEGRCDLQLGGERLGSQQTTAVERQSSSSKPRQQGQRKMKTDAKRKPTTAGLAERKFDGRANFGADDEIESLLDRHFSKYGLSQKEVCRNFQIYTRRIFLKRFLAHYEFFRMVVDLPGDIVELGVYRGASLMSWANFLEIRNMSDRQKQVFGFDNFTGFTGLTGKDGSADKSVAKDVGGFDSSAFRDMLIDAISIFDRDRFIPYKPRVKLVEGNIEETVPRFVREKPGLRICLLHFDCDMYMPTKVGLEHFWPLVVPGGVVLFDEYGIRPWEGESNAVDEYFADKKVAIRRLDWSPNPGGYVIKA